MILRMEARRFHMALGSPLVGEPPTEALGLAVAQPIAAGMRNELVQPLDTRLPNRAAKGTFVMDAPLSIFLSCGSPHTAQQEEFISAVEAHLKSHGCVPQTVGRTNHSLRQPVQAARNLIAQCHGAVVIASERTWIMQAVERRDSPKQKNIENESYPTVWNHMEAAMAYSKQVPILTFVQTGLKREGMLSDRLEWMALETDLSPAILRTPQFQQIFEEWLRLVRDNANDTNDTKKTSSDDLDLGEISLGAFLSRLKIKQLVAIGVAVFSILSGLATAAFKLGQNSSSPSKNAQQAGVPNVQKSAPRNPGS